MKQSPLILNIYLITNSVNGKVYVGKTEKPVDARLHEHKAHARRGGKFRLSQAIRKHGPEAFSVLTLETVHFEVASERERYWIAQYDSKKYTNGYNMTDGGEGTPGVLITEERVENLRKGQQTRFAKMDSETKSSMTKAANDAKRGQKEKPGNKSEAQNTRWAKAGIIDRVEHGQRSQAGISPEGKSRQVQALADCFSPVRTKGYKQAISKCPVCGKEGGAAAMKRYHFDRCKL